MVTDKRIGVLMGGISAEREVSLRSGEAVVRALDGRGYPVVTIDVGKDICETLKREKVEVAFLVLHGGHGENGGIQGLLEVMEIPYTGSGILASALAMDKEAAKKVFLYHRIPVSPFVVLSVGGVTGSPGEGTSPPVDFGFPWVVKPVAEGSSIGVSIVRDEGSVRPALEQASRHGGRVIIERYIEGKEVQVGILGERVLGSVEVRPKQEFYSYEAKYTPGLTEYILPPEIDSRVLAKAEETALAAHRALGCTGATRVDLIIDRAGTSYLLEVNTIPGMTETSLLPKIALQSGLDFPSLVESILEHAVAGRGTR